MLALPFSGFSLPAKSINAVHGKLLCNSNFLQQHWHFLNIHFRWKIAREKQIREKQIAPSVLADATTGFCTKWRLIEKLAQKFHTDDASLLRSRLCLWLAENFLRAIRSTTQICRHSNPPDLIGSLPIWCVASRSPDFYQVLPIYHKILKRRKKLLIL